MNSKAKLHLRAVDGRRQSAVAREVVPVCPIHSKYVKVRKSFSIAH